MASLKNDFLSRVDKRHLTWCHSATPDQLHACFSVGIPAAKYIEDKLPAEKAVQVDPAVKLGDIGEMYVANILRTRYGENSVNVTSASSASADIHLSIYSGGKETSIIVEVKNYSSSVASTEVEKFRRDISISSHCAGLFISLTSPISRMDEFNIIYEKNSSRLIPCVYLHTSDANMICTSIAILLNLSKASDDLANFSGNRSAEIRDNLNIITRMRDELNAATSAYFTKISKINADIACAQSNILHLMRSDFNADIVFTPEVKGGSAETRTELGVKESSDKVSPMLNAFENYPGYSLDVKRVLSDIVNMIEAKTHADINGVAKRLKNNLVFSSAVISFNKAPVITLDTKEKAIDPDDYRTLMTLGATISTDQVCLPVGVASFDFIAKILKL